MEKAYGLQLNELHKNHSELYLCFCGHAQCEPVHSFGPAVRADYLIHVVLKGKGSFRSGSKTYTLERGQGFLITPSAQTYYVADEQDPWDYCWIGFNGSKCAEYLNDFGLNENHPIFKTLYWEQLKDIVVQMLQHDRAGSYHEFFHQGLLYQFFAWLAKELHTDLPASETERKNYYVQNAITYIKNNYAHKISINHIAEYVCINRSYLFTLFKSELGVSPLEYISLFRLSLGADLLATTDLSIEHIAASCGYRNSLVFSKAFKQKRGMTPSQYRKNRNSSWSTSMDYNIDSL